MITVNSESFTELLKASRGSSIEQLLELAHVTGEFDTDTDTHDSLTVFICAIVVCAPALCPAFVYGPSVGMHSSVHSPLLYS